ncbi:cytochrome P450 [Nonomuraea maheshkhaliensis]
MRDAPLEFVTAMAAHGDVTRHDADGEPVYMLNRPDLARYVLKENGTNYTKDRTPDDDMLRPLLGNGLLTSNGAEWAAQRRRCAPAFRPAEVNRFDQVIVAAAEQLAAQWRGSGPVRVDHDLTSLTLTVIVKAMLGTDIGGAGEGFGRAVDAVNRFIGHYVPSDDPDPADTAARYVGFQRARAFLDQVTRVIIAARRAGGPGDDLLSALLTDGHPHPGTGPAAAGPAGGPSGGPSGGPGAGPGAGPGGGPGGPADVELRDQVLTIVMAGHETTAKSLTWTLYLLDRHPEAAAAVRAEIDEVLDGRAPTAADLPALRRCRQAVQEAMRLYPPVWLISRRSVAADVIDGYDIPAGSLVCVSPWVLHRDPRYWDDPAVYRPERFDPEQAARHLSHQYLPFGGGPRICLGQHFALVEATLVLAVILRDLRMELVPGFPVEPEALVTLRPRHGLMMVPRPR